MIMDAVEVFVIDDDGQHRRAARVLGHVARTHARLARSRIERTAGGAADARPERSDSGARLSLGPMVSATIYRR